MNIKQKHLDKQWHLRQAAGRYMLLVDTKSTVE